MNNIQTKRSQKGLSAILSAAVAISALAFSTSSMAQEYKKITRLGTSQSVCDGGVETAAQLQAFFKNNPDKIRAILADSGWSGSADALLEAVANGEMTETSFPVGTKMAWMGSKKGGKYVALPYREWAGSKSFDGFSLKVKDQCQIYDMAIPKACCNVSLLAVAADTTGECAPKPVVSPAQEVAPVAPVAVVEEPKAKPALGLIPFIGAFVGTETVPRFEERWQMDKKDSSGVVGVRAGLLKALSAKTSLAGSVSYYDRNGINGGNIYPEDNFALDLGLERKLSERAFIGGGLGAWNVDDSDFREASVYGIVGGDIGKSNVQWFLEGRIFDTDSQLDSISENKMVSAGIRYLIK